MSEALRKYESSDPDALFLINGDFNHSKLLQSGNQYYQHIHCTTRNTATHDYCYSNVKDSYSTIQVANLDESDHNLVFVRPKYLQSFNISSLKQYLLKTGLLRQLPGYKALLDVLTGLSS